MADSNNGRRVDLPFLDTTLPFDLAVSRRDMLKIGGAMSLAAFIAACGGSATPAGGTVTMGSNHSDAAEKRGMDAIAAAFKSSTGNTLKLNTVDHNTFQDQISSYLQGTPDDVFTWFSGHRMRFFADKGLATPIDDVWDKVKGNYTEAFSTAVKGNDGHVYGIPVDYYPWAVFYRKSVFQAHSYKVPTSWDDLIKLCQQMKKDGLTPIALGDKDGWPAQGTFDIINLRLNGYDFHIELLTGKQKWTDPRVTATYKKWAELTPYYPSGFAGTTWQQGADTVVQKKAGMIVFGLFLSQEFSGPGDLDDLDFFPFPDLGTQYDAEKALDAPIDVVMMSKKSPNLSKDLSAAKSFLEFYAKGSSQLLLFKNAPGFIPTATDTDKSSFSPLQTKAAQIISNAKRITQFFDRDSRPDFAGANGMQSFLLTFLRQPQADPTQLQGKMQQFWDQLPQEA
ncbi:MAG: carbohydrate ABC transporter substrate-binding protein [Chloroflexi bacterium]|nr:MAG: carbohydrate ABC transporter substrate-binding protein [Chloroflexota bacterium]